MKNTKHILVITAITLLLMALGVVIAYQNIKPEKPLYLRNREAVTETEYQQYIKDEAQYKTQQIDAMEKSLTLVFEIVLPILLTIIAFWLKKFVDRVDQLTLKLDSVTVTQASQTANCAATHTALSNTLSRHGSELRELAQTVKAHEGRIGKLEGEIEK